MPKFIYISDNKIELYSPVDIINFTCISEQLLIDFVTVNPSNALVQWTQIAGSHVTILNDTTINPTIIFPQGFNTEAGEVILVVSSPGSQNLSLTLRVNTRIISDYTTSTVLPFNRNTYLPQDSIPSSLIYYYDDYYNQDTSVVYNTSNSTARVTYNNLNISNLSIIKIEWLNNINGIYQVTNTNITPNKDYIYTRGVNTKANIYYQINGLKNEVVATNILDTSRLNNSATLGVSNYVNNSSTNSNSSFISNISKAFYILSILNTYYTYDNNDDYYQGNQTYINTSYTSNISTSFYVFNNIVTDQDYGDEVYKLENCLLHSSLVSTITRSSYIFNNSGFIIG